MKTFLEKYQSIAPVVQKIILERAGQRDGAASVPLDSIAPVSAFAAQHGVTDPRSYNEFQALLYTDLAAAYAEMQSVDQLTSQTESLYKRTAFALRDGITRLSRKLEKYRNLINLGNGTSNIFFESFIDSSAKETNRKFYVDTEGLITSAVFDANIDKDSETLTLPQIGNVSRIRSARYRNKIARFEVDEKLGTAMSLFANNDRHDSDKAIDGDRDSFWAETALSDQPVRVKPTWWQIAVFDVGISITVGNTVETWIVRGKCPRINGVISLPATNNGQTLMSDWIYTDVFAAAWRPLVGVPGTPGEYFSCKVDTDLDYAPAAQVSNPLTSIQFFAAMATVTRMDQFGARHVDLNSLQDILQTIFTTSSVRVELIRYTQQSGIRYQVPVGTTTGTFVEPVEIQYPISDGVACKCHVMFQFKSPINKLTLKPFSHGQMELVGLYTTGIDNEEEALLRGDVKYIIMDPVLLDDHHVIHFDRHDAKRVYLVFNQHNYVRNIYNIPRSQLNNIEMRNNLAKAESEFTVDLMDVDKTFEEINSPELSQYMRRNRALSQRQVDGVTGWDLFLQYVARVQAYVVSKATASESYNKIIEAMGMILRDKGLIVNEASKLLSEVETTKAEQVRMTFYEYRYGLYDIDLTDTYYGYTGNFISVPYKSGGRAVEYTLRWEAPCNPDGVSAWISYAQNSTSPEWVAVGNGVATRVLWPENTDLVATEEKFQGGRGAIIVPASPIYIHPCALTNQIAIPSESGVMGAGRVISISGESSTYSGGIGTWVTNVSQWSMKFITHSNIPPGIDISLWDGVVIDRVIEWTGSWNGIDSITRHEKGTHVLDASKITRITQVGARNSLSDFSITITGSVAYFNMAKGCTGSNRAYEPFASDKLAGYESPTSLWAFDGPGPVSDSVDQILQTWAQGSQKNFPIILFDGSTASVTGITDDPDSICYAGTILGAAIKNTHRVYYRPISVTVYNGAKSYGPDPFGEPYFIEGKDLTMPYSVRDIMKLSVTGIVRAGNISGNIEGQWQVPILTFSGEDRFISMKDMAYYMSDTDIERRVVKWDYRTDVDTVISRYKIRYSTVLYDLSLPNSGVIVVGIKNWTDANGNLLPDQSIPGTITNTKIFNAVSGSGEDAVYEINGDQVDLVYPICTENRSDIDHVVNGTPTPLQTGGAPSKVNMHFEEGYVTPIDGWIDSAGNRRPYLGYYTIKLDSFVKKQPRYLNMGIVTKNVTDYHRASRPQLKVWDLDPVSDNYYPVIEYYHDTLRNRVVFSKSLPTEWTVKISYATYAADVRVKFLLEGTMDASPVIDNYRLEAKEV